MPGRKPTFCYLDNAATSFPKPPQVVQAMVRAMRTAGNSGRSAHSLAIQAARIQHQVRSLVAHLLGVENPTNVILTPSCTASINWVIGALPKGSHVVTSSMEHNAVARTLVALRQARRITFTPVKAVCDGFVDPLAVAAACTPKTRLIVLAHASNVSGTIQDIPAIRSAVPRSIPLLLDAAQTGGIQPIHVEQMGLDYVALPGHKGLLGPTGTGLLLLGKQAPPLVPGLFGGTGSVSESDRMPTFLPDMLEAGTPNIPGAAGLAAGIQFLNSMGRNELLRKEGAFTTEILHGLSGLSHIRLVGSADAHRHTGTFSVVVHDMDPGLAAVRLEREQGILTRPGLHCAPWAHASLGTLPAGTLRFSWGPTSPDDAAARILNALESLKRGTP